MPKIIHYRSKCIGCGICHEMQPDVWRMSKKDGKAVLLNAVNKKEIFQAEIHAIQVSTAQQVVAACPSKVIKLV